MEDETTVTATPAEKPTLTPDQETQFLNDYFSGNYDPDAPADFGKKEPETPSQAPDTPSQNQAQAPAQQQGAAPEEPTDGVIETLESLQEKLRVMEERYQNANKKIIEQGQELGRLRPLAAQPAPGQQRTPFLQIPQFQPQQPLRQPPGVSPQQPFDFTDPNSHRQIARSEAEETVNRILQEREAQAAQQQQQKFITDFGANVVAHKQRLSAEKNIPETVIDDAITRFQAAFMEGRIADLAYAFANQDALIQEAEKRGEANALKKLQAVQNQPRRAAAVSSQTATAQDKSVKDMTFAEMQDAVKTLKPGDPKLDEIGQLLFRA